MTLCPPQEVNSLEIARSRIVSRFSPPLASRAIGTRRLHRLPLVKVTSSASHYGKQTEVYNGVDVTLKARFADVQIAVERF